MNEDEETWIVVNQASRLDKLITPLQIYVASYLSYQEASAFCCASRDCPKMRSVDVELEETASDFNNHPSSGYAAVRNCEDRSDGMRSRREVIVT